MKKNKKKKECSFCEMRKKMKNAKGEKVRESYARIGDIQSYLQERKFAATKPFKLNFKEGFSILWENGPAERANDRELARLQRKSGVDLGVRGTHREGGAITSRGEGAQQRRMELQRKGQEKFGEE